MTNPKVKRDLENEDDSSLKNDGSTVYHMYQYLKKIGKNNS